MESNARASSDSSPAPHPALDPELAAMLVLATPPATTTLEPDDIDECRQTLALSYLSDEDLRRGGAIEFDDHVVPGPAGAPDISLLICRPSDVREPTPAIYYMHGGGMIAGNRRFGLEGVLDWILWFGVVLVSVEYRLAPEHPDPAPSEDCYAGLTWVTAHAAELGIDPGRVIVAGLSAGGGLAAAMALMAADRGGPSLIGQILMSPMLDDRMQTPSSKMLDGVGVWDRTSNVTGWRALLGGRQGGPDVSHYAAPARAGDLAGLPPAFLDVGAVDTFRDEVVEYASRIASCGGSAELHVWPGGFHAFDRLAPEAALSRIAQKTRTDWLRRLLARHALGTHLTGPLSFDEGSESPVQV